jgi:hypothetical protein
VRLVAFGSILAGALEEVRADGRVVAVEVINLRGRLAALPPPRSAPPPPDPRPPPP